MATTNMNIRTDVEVKAAAEQLFSELGLNLTTAVNIFLRQAIRTGAIQNYFKESKPSYLGGIAYLIKAARGSVLLPLSAVALCRYTVA